MSELSDEALLRQFNAGIEAAFAQLVERHAAMVYRTCSRILGGSASADDAAQVVFLVAARKMRQLHGRGGLGPWLYRTAVRVAGNARRADQRRCRRLAQEHPSPAADSADAAWSAARPLLDDAIQSLRPKQREAVLLHYFQGVSQVEAGRRLGCSEAAVRQRLESAIAHLRRHLLARDVGVASSSLILQLGHEGLMPCPAHLRDECVSAARGADALRSAAAKALAAGVAAPVGMMLVVLATAALVSLLLMLRITADPAHASEPAVGPPVALQRTAATDPHADALPPVSTISGVVIDASTHLPMAGIDLTVHQEHGAHFDSLPLARTSYGEPMATTDANGRYCLRFLIAAPDMQQIQLFPGGVTTTIYRGEDITVEPIALAANVAMRGRITDLHGHPIAGAVLNEGNTARMLVTDQDGWFTDPCAGSGLLFWDVAAPGYRQARISCAPPAPGASLGTFTLATGPSVVGSVVRDDGQPANDMRVFAGFSSSLAMLPVWSTPVDAQGRFAMRTVPEAGRSWWLFPVRDGRICGLPQKMGPGLGEVRLQLFSTGSVSSTVIDEHGHPIVGASVFACSQSGLAAEMGVTGRGGFTDAHGTAIIDEVPTGATLVTVSSLRSQSRKPFILPSQQIQVEAGHAASCTLAVLPSPPSGPRVTGILHDQQGHPLLHVMVGACVRREGQGMTLFHGADFTQVDGRFVVEMPPEPRERMGRLRWEPPAPEQPDQVRMVAQFVGFSLDVLDLTRNYPATCAQLDLGTIAVEVQPARTVTIRAHGPGHPTLPVWIDGCQDSAGHAVEFQRLPGSQQGPDCRIIIRHVGMVRILLHDDLGDHAEALTSPMLMAEACDVEFPPGRTVSLQLRDAQGQPLAGVSWYGHPTAPPWFLPPVGGMSVSDAQGRIVGELAVPAAGTYMLYRDLEHELFCGTITAGSTPIQQVITLGPARGRLSGQVTDADGQVVDHAGANLQLSCGTGLGIQFDLPLDAQGRFDVRVPSGITITVHAYVIQGQGFMQASSAQLSSSPVLPTVVHLVLRPLFPAPPAPRRAPPAVNPPGAHTDF